MMIQEWKISLINHVELIWRWSELCFCSLDLSVKEYEGHAPINAANFDLDLSPPLDKDLGILKLADKYK